MKLAFFLFLMVVVVYSNEPEEETTTLENEYTKPVLPTIKTLSSGEDTDQTNAVISLTPIPGPPDPDCNATKVSDLSNNSLTLTINTSQDGVQRYQARIPNIQINSTWDRSRLLITGLSAGTSYNIHLQSVGVNNVTSKLSCNITAVTRPPDPDCSATKVSDLSNNSLTLTINTSQDGVQRYQAHIPNITINSTWDRSRLLITGLSAGTSYNIHLQSVGVNNVTSTLSCNITAVTQPNKPNCSRVKVTKRTTNSISLILPTTDSIKGHRVDSSNQIDIDSKENGSYTLITLTNLQPGGAYNITIQAVGNGKITSLDSCGYTAFTCPADKQCDDVTHVKETPTSVVLKVPFSQGTLGYFARFTNNCPFSMFNATLEKGADIFFSGLHEGTEYRFEIMPVIQDNITCSSCYVTTNTRPWNPFCDNEFLVHSVSEGNISLNLSSIIYNASNANLYVINVTSTRKSVKHNASRDTVIYNITDLEPATNYIINIKLGIADEDGVIRSISQDGCTLSRYTRPYLDCNNVSWSPQANGQAVLLDPNTAPHAQNILLEILPSRRTEVCVNNINEVCRINLDLGSSYNISMLAVGGDNATSQPCSYYIENRPGTPNCSNVFYKVTAHQLLVNLANVSSNGADRYDTHMSGGSTPDSRRDVEKTKLQAYIDLKADTLYTLEITAVGKNNQPSARPCTVSQYTKPENPTCDNAKWNSSYDSVTFDLTDMTTDDTIAHWVNLTTSNKSNNKVKNSNSKYSFLGLQEGSCYNFTVTSIGHDNQTSDGSCLITVYTRPKDPVCDEAKVEKLSPTIIVLSLENLRTDGATAYTIVTDSGINITHNQQEPYYNFTKLIPGTLYSFIIYSVSKNNMMSQHPCVYMNATDPAQPGQLSSLNKSTTWIVVNWNAPKGHVDSYNVSISCQCRQDNQTCKPVVENSDKITAPTANISHLVPGTHCKLSISAVSNGLKSESREIEDIESKEEKPGKVSNITVDISSITTSSVTLSWLPPSQPNGDITNYTVSISTLSNTRVYTNTSYATSSSVQQLTPGTCYVISVFASSREYDGEPDCVTVYTNEEKPRKVSNLTAQSPSSRSMLVKWQKPEMPNGVIAFYTVRVMHNEQCMQSIQMYCTSCQRKCPTAVSSRNAESLAKHDVSEQKCTITKYNTISDLSVEYISIEIGSLEPYTNYTFEVTASTSIGTGTASTILSRTLEDRPTVVRELHIQDVGVNSITIHFIKPTPSNGVILGYVVQYQYRNHSSNYCDDDSTKNLELVFNKTIDTKQDDDTQTVTFDKLFPYWSYSFKVAANTSVGYGNWSYSIENRTLSAAPGRVRNIKVADITANSVSVSWIQPCFQNGQIDQYLITVLSTSGAKNDTVPGTQLQYQAAGLLPFKVYNISISGHTKDTKWGEMAHYMGNITTLTDVPNASTNVIGHTISSTSLNVTWTPGEPQTGPTSYVVSAYDTKTGGNVSACIAEGFSKTWCVIQNLDQYWSYTLIVVASTVNGSTNSTKSPLVTTAQDAPGKIQSLQVSVEEDATRPRQVNVSWKRPKERDLNGKIQHYYVEFYANGKKELSETQFSLDNVNVVAGKNYTFTVYASTIKNGTEVIKTSVVIPMGAPPLIKKLLIQTGPTGLISNDEKQLSIYLQKKYLCDSENGIPVNWGIIVSEDSETGQTAEPFRGNYTEYVAEQKKRYKIWSQVHESDKMEPYIASNAFDPECPSRRRKRDTSEPRVKFVVGSDGDCDSSKEICNGYLKPGKKYRVRSWSCTLGGCVESEYSTPLSTEPNKVPLIAGVSTSCTVVFMAVAIVTLLYLRRTQKGPFRKKAESDGGHSNEGFDGTGESVEMHKKRKAPRPVKLTDFENHVGRMHGDSDLLFRDEYELLKNTCPRHPATVAEGQGARTKNRYTNILAYDHSRVKLLPSDDEEGSDYINANYIPGFSGQREFIATQGPQASTIDDFWRMIWEQSVTTIVMLTQLVERGRRKCDQYWPEKPFEPVFHGDIVVELTSESTLPNYMLREFALKLGGVTRKVKHFQYLDWPDMGTPETSDSMIGFVRNVRSHVPVTNKGPIVVHCSAGVGRTGTFIAVDHLIHHVKQHATIDIYGLVMSLRNNRNNMVQTEDQYVFIHDCMNDFINNDDDESDEDQENVYENA